MVVSVFKLNGLCKLKNRMSTTVNTLSKNSLSTPLDINGDDLDKDLYKPFKYIISVPGKAVRQNLAEVFRYWMEVPDDTFEKIVEIACNIHNATLMLDDIQDFSELRRGIPATHKIYGIPRTIISADRVYISCMQLVEDLDNDEFTYWVTDAFRQAFAGQGFEIHWRDNCICPTEAEYYLMVTRKTGIVFTFIANSMNIFATGKKLDAYRLVTLLGMYFQINDDYQNLQNKAYHDSKGFCEDIGEGKYSFPIVHAVRNFPEEAKEIQEIMKMRTHDVEIKKRCLEIIEKCGSFEYTREVLRKLRSEIDVEHAKFGKNPLMEEFLSKGYLLNM